jgi:hypothetical protein
MSVPATTGTQRSASSLASYAQAPVPAPVPAPAFSHAYQAVRATVSAMEEASAYYPAPSSSSSGGGGGSSGGGEGGGGERFRSQFALEQYGQQQRSSFETSSGAGRSAPPHPPLASARGEAGRGSALEDSAHSRGGASNLQYGLGARAGDGNGGGGGGAGAGTRCGARHPYGAGKEPVDAFQPQYGSGRRVHHHQQQQQQQYRTSSMGSLLSHDPAPAPAPAGSGAREGPGYYSSAGRR